MPPLFARCIARSLAGFAAAKGRALDAPVGKAGPGDELHFVQAPVVLGSGESVLAGWAGLSDRDEVADYIPSKTVAHVRSVKKAG
jgi:hypothetical protein